MADDLDGGDASYTDAVLGKLKSALHNKEEATKQLARIDSDVVKLTETRTKCGGTSAPRSFGISRYRHNLLAPALTKRPTCYPGSRPGGGNGRPYNHHPSGTAPKLNKSEARTSSTPYSWITASAAVTVCGRSGLRLCRGRAT